MCGLADMADAASARRAGVRDVRGARRRWRVSLGLRRLAKCVRADIALMRLSSLELAAFRLRDREGVCAGWCGMRMR